MLSVLTINIGAAAQPRSEAILEWLTTRDDDVLILTETSGGAGTRFLCDQFRRAGWHVHHQPDTNGDRGVALISRIAILDSPTTYFGAVTLPGRVVAVTLDTEPQICVVGVYVPSRDRSSDKTEKKQRFIESLSAGLDALPPADRGVMVIGGDYNVIARDHRPRHPGFLPFEYGLLETLQRHEFADAHDVLHPGSQVHSWIGRTGDGYRYDYFHVGKVLRDTIIDSAYLHETRDRRLTDHAAVSLILDLPAKRHHVSGLVAPTGEAMLF